MNTKRFVGAIAAFAIAPIVQALPAHADTTMTVQQICAEVGPNEIPMRASIATGDIGCGDSTYWGHGGRTPGLFFPSLPPISETATRLHPGARSTDPANPWADWIIP